MIKSREEVKRLFSVIRNQDSDVFLVRRAWRLVAIRLLEMAVPAFLEKAPAEINRTLKFLQLIEARSLGSFPASEGILLVRSMHA
jgi:hypothetical protein